MDRIGHNYKSYTNGAPGNYGGLSLSDFNSVKQEFLNIVPTINVGTDPRNNKTCITLSIPALSTKARKFMTDNNLNIVARLVRHKQLCNRNIKHKDHEYPLNYYTSDALWYPGNNSRGYSYRLTLGRNNNHSLIADSDIEKVFNEVMWPICDGKINYLTYAADSIFYYYKNRSSLGFLEMSSKHHFDDSYIKYYICVCVSRRGNADGSHILSEVSDRPIFVRTANLVGTSRTTYNLSAKSAKDYLENYGTDPDDPNNYNLIDIIEIS